MSLRRLLWVSGYPARWILIGAVLGYRATLGGLLGGNCRFYPSCSTYALLAIRHLGAVRGGGLALWRVLRCQPFAHGGVEYPPGLGPGTDRPSRHVGRAA